MAIAGNYSGSNGGICLACWRPGQVAWVAKLTCSSSGHVAPGVTLVASLRSMTAARASCRQSFRTASVLADEGRACCKALGPGGSRLPRSNCGELNESPRVEEGV